VQLVGEDEESETVAAFTEQMTLDGDAREMPVYVQAMWTTPQTSGRASSSPSPPLSAVSFPTRGSLGGSVMSAPTARYPEGPQGLPPTPAHFPIETGLVLFVLRGWPLLA
jgi:hypothetical protein